MSTLAPSPLAEAPLLPRLLALCGAARLHAAVVVGGQPSALLADVGELGLPTTVVDARPDVVAGLAPGTWHRVVAGAPARTLADLRRQLPERTLYLLGPGGMPCSTVREQIAQVPSGAGVVAVRLDGTAGASGRADVEDALLRWSPDHHVEWLVAGDGEVVLLALPQPPVHVTFLIEKYTHEYGTSGPSINLDNLVATLQATGRATHDVVHYDERFQEGRALHAEDLVAGAAASTRHVVVVTLHYHSRANPTPALLQALRDRGSRIVMVWLDKKISRSTGDYYRLADVNVVLDGNDWELPHALPLFTPKNPRFFHDPGLPRDVAVSLVGEVRHLPQRRAMVARLRAETRVPVTLFGTSAADTGRTLAVADYARLYQRSRISLALTKDNVRQLKGRVFEIVHCGALLCCDVNHHVQHYFKPGREYVQWHDYEHLVDRLQHFLRHDDERAAIAAAGHRRATAYYNHDVFWRAVLSRAGASALACHERAVTGGER